MVKARRRAETREGMVAYSRIRKTVKTIIGAPGRTGRPGALHDQRKEEAMWYVISLLLAYAAGQVTVVVLAVWYAKKKQGDAPSYWDREWRRAMDKSKSRN